MSAIETGKFIRQLRKEKHLNQQDLAACLNISNKTISRWETGEGYPEVTVLIKLAEILDVTADELILGRKEPKLKKDNKDYFIRLKNASMVHKVNMIIVFIIWFTRGDVIYATSLGLIMCSVTLLWVLIERNILMTYDLKDYKSESILYTSLRNAIVPYILFIVISVPHVISTMKHPLGFVPGLSYLPYAIIDGYMAFFALFIYFTWIYKRGKFRHLKKLNFIRYSFYGFVLLYIYIFGIDFSFDSWIAHALIIAPFVFMYIIYTTYDLAFKGKSITNALLRTSFIGLIIYLSLFRNVSLILTIIAFTVFFVTLIGALILFVNLFKENKLDSTFKMAYHSILLAIYLLTFGLFGLIPYFLILIVGWILLDQLIYNHPSSKHHTLDY